MIPQPLKNIDVSKPLKDQQKPEWVCEPGDPRVEQYGWTIDQFSGYISIIENTIWISSIWSLQPGNGHFSKMIRAMHAAGYEIKVPGPFPHMRCICKHLGFTKTIEDFPEAHSDIIVYILSAKEGFS